MLSEIPPISLEAPGVLSLMRVLIKQKDAPLSDDVRLISEQMSENPLLVYRPKEPLRCAALLYIHGGGLVAGAPEINQFHANMIAEELGITVICPAYRLAPENRAPAAIDDCWSAWQWTLAQAEHLGFDPANIVIAGSSAGGGLAACLCQRILDQGGVQPAAQVLFYPMLDDRTAANRSLDAINHFIWSNASNRFGWDGYLGTANVGCDKIGQYLAAARREDLSGLPPTWIGVGDIDLFHQESRDYADRLAQAGVSAELAVFKGAPHGFYENLPKAPMSKDFMAAANAFIERHVSGR